MEMVRVIVGGGGSFRKYKFSNNLFQDYDILMKAID